MYTWCSNFFYIKKDTLFQLTSLTWIIWSPQVLLEIKTSSGKEFDLEPGMMIIKLCFVQIHHIKAD